MQLQLQGGLLEFSNRTGSLKRFCLQDQELLQPAEDLFVLHLLMPGGNLQRLRSREFTDVEATSSAFTFTNHADAALMVRVNLSPLSGLGAPGLEVLGFLFQVEHEGEGLIERIECPVVNLHPELTPAREGCEHSPAQLFWPAQEGCLISDLRLRDESWLKAETMTYPSKGWSGYYPGPVSMQFMAASRDGVGLYFAAHDAVGYTKNIDYVWDKECQALRLVIETFPGGWGRGSHSLPFPIVLGAFEGDWQQATRIYGSWARSAAGVMPENPSRFPDWVEESPVVVAYPLRGEGDHVGRMEPNEYFPHEKALPVLSELSEKLDSSLMALLMHWEGTAPWAPPYVWPPLGGEKSLAEFAEALHHNGHVLGLYCSGLGWTQRSSILTEYDRREQYHAENLQQVMCAGPDGEIRGHVCVGEEGAGQRLGMDLCPACDWVRQTVVDEVEKMARTGCDYIQLFDQNLGGSSNLCYAANHGHPPAPGPWQAAAVQRLCLGIQGRLRQAGKPHLLIGCEAAAAEPFIDRMHFNDLRWNVGLMVGMPVPAYNMLFHPQVRNFMGNQVDTPNQLDHQACPDSLYYRYAYSFIIGDLLTVVLGPNGTIHWGWVIAWNEVLPEQDELVAFIAALNRFRKSEEGRVLREGRLLRFRTDPSENQYELPLRSGFSIAVPAVLETTWETAEGQRYCVRVNWTSTRQTIDGVTLAPRQIWLDE